MNPFITQKLEDFRKQFDELGMKQPKNSMPNLERELIIDYWRKALEEAYTKGREECLGEMKESIKVMAKTPSPYERNHSMPSHGGETLTNSYRNGYNQCLVDLSISLKELKP